MAEIRGKRSIGLFGAVAALVGLVIGASVFILHGDLYNTAGSAYWISFLIASVPAIFAALTAAQLGVCYPENGALLVAISDLISPNVGFVAGMFMSTGAMIAAAFLAYGTTDYFLNFATDWPLGRTSSALLIVAIITIVNILGVTAAVRLQELMVGALIIVVVIFVAFGAPSVDVVNFTPRPGTGFSDVLGASVPATFSFLGLIYLVEIGGEIRNPGTNIPRAVAISFGIILFLYLGTAFTTIGIVPGETLAGNSTAVLAAANIAMPGWFAGVVGIAAIFAAVTSINGIILLVSREIQFLASAGYGPWILARGSGSHGNPAAGILFAGAVVSAFILVGSSLQEYAVATVFGFMVGQILAGIAILKLPAKGQERLANARFRLGRRTLAATGAGLILTSAGMAMLALDAIPAVAPALAAFVLLAALMIYFRRKV